MGKIITLLTDFGTRDGFVGAMKGVILSIDPSAVIVDITHHIAPQNIYQAAFVLGNAYRFFPPDTIHLAIVDPGVGTQRLPIILSTPNATLVAPDNGLASLILADVPMAKFPEHDSVPFPPSPMQMALPPTVAAVEINDDKYWLPVLSNTFHGRDIFAPVAAHLSLGIGMNEIGRRIDSLFVFPAIRPRQMGDEVTACVVHIDTYGNLITNIRATDLRHHLHAVVDVAGQQIQGISGSYAEAQGLLAVFGGYGYLEIALRDGSAASILKAAVGDEVRVKMQPVSQ